MSDQVWRDVRCQGQRRAGGLCNQLLQRVAVGTAGVWETKCPRCGTIRVIRIDGKVAANGGTVR